MTFVFEDETEEIELDSEMQEDAYGDEEGEFYTEADFRSRGVDPVAPTNAKPGSEGKVLMLAARYAAGLPLWHQEDCYDHGPKHRVSI